MFVGLVLLMLLGVLSWLTKRVHRRGLGGATGRERVALTADHSVHVIELGGVRLLVGTGPSGAPRVLANLGEVELAESDAAPEPSLARPWAELGARLGRRETMGPVWARLFGVAGGR
ncbi:hypothetical protein ENSA5_54760 [Enhygromyxa salina]|uniref:Flagellar protein n=1 Tax=Enhygromyxa salina TaxID=215803 RepID=A0A2S9XF64_9BACT|nr:hypothetical protein ENSA5_54760 [Enhygromyxa salina]